MKRSALVALACTLALAACAGGLGPRLSWWRITEPFAIADNLYYVGSEGLSAFLIDAGGGELVLIDAGFPSTAWVVERNIRRLGFEPDDVTVLLNTHAHSDHAGGLAGIKRRIPRAKLWASPKDAPALRKGVYAGSEGKLYLRYPRVEVDALLEDKKGVAAGTLSLTPHLTPGHSPGCTTWMFPVRVKGEELTALVSCSTNVALNSLGGRKQAQYPEIVSDFRKTFERLRGLRADIFLAGHAEEFDLARKRAALEEGDARAFVNPRELAAYVEASERDFEAALKAQGVVEP